MARIDPSGIKVNGTICPFCSNPITLYIDPAEERLRLNKYMTTGYEIHQAIENKKYLSLDLCDLDYRILLKYRLSNR